MFARRSAGARGMRIEWEGHDVVVMESRHLRVAVSLTRGGEILELRDKRTDVDVLWHAEPQMLRAATPTVNRPQGNFLDAFAGGWQEVFPNGGGACEYRGAALGQHGEVALLPWDAAVERDDGEALSVRFSVACRRMPLRLERTLTIDAESASLHWRGRIASDAPQEIDCMWGQHPAFGPPLVAPGAQLVLPEGTRCEVHAAAVEPGGTYRYAAGVSEWPHVTGAAGDPLRLDVLPEADGTDGHVFFSGMSRGCAEIRNGDLGLGLRLEWDPLRMPVVWSWGVYGGARDWPLWGRHYLLCIEPFSTDFMTLAEAAERGAAIRLPAYGSMETDFRVTFLAL